MLNILVVSLSSVSYTHLRAHETLRYLVCRLLLEKKISFLELNIVSDGDLYLLIKDAITLSFLDKYFLAVFQYLGVLLMPSDRYSLLKSHFSFKYYE